MVKQKREKEKERNVKQEDTKNINTLFSNNGI